MDASVARRPAPLLRPGIAERLWEASRVEFSLRGYHGARVQGIARRAGCNVALLYRHWSSKKGLYLDVLRSIWLGILREVVADVERGPGASSVVRAYLDANMRDPVGAQIIIREVLDGGPFLSQILASEPALMDPIRRAAEAMTADGAGGALRPGIDATVAVLAIGGLSALMASAQEAARLFFDRALSPDEWRRQIHELLVHGVLPCPGRPGDVEGASADA
jgi:AcrR family transcriptional regulator